jgi:hypothetical protein
MSAERGVCVATGGLAASVFIPALSSREALQWVVVLIKEVLIKLCLLNWLCCRLGLLALGSSQGDTGCGELQIKKASKWHADQQMQNQRNPWADVNGLASDWPQGWAKHCQQRKVLINFHHQASYSLINAAPWVVRSRLLTKRGAIIASGTLRRQNAAS